jgi:pyruvyltransferase
LFNRVKGKLIRGLEISIRKIDKIITLKTWINTYYILRGERLAAYWWRGKDNKNWGDKINPWLMQRLSGKEIVHVDDMINFRFINVHTCIGSIVEHLHHKGIHIWGPGVISETSVLKINPKNIHAVRGPSTRNRLAENGFQCPEVYGDPALLMPRFYTPDVKKTIELGIIPHFVDKENDAILRLEKEGVKIIDIFAGETEFLDQVNRCEHVVSSSLHGLIVADAYGIPSKWIKISDKVFGDDFK